VLSIWGWPFVQGVSGRLETGAPRKENVMAEPRVLVGGLGIPESPRWHEGRLWFCNWIDRQIVAAGLDGRTDVMVTRDPASHPMGYSIDWLPDGRLLSTGDQGEDAAANLERLATGPRTGEILALPVEVPGIGRP
jgi:hypothetical protein